MQSFKFFTKPAEIRAWLHQNTQHSGSIDIQADGTVNISGYVKIENNVSFTRLPVKFGRVGDDFKLINLDDLVSLEGCPSVVGGTFDVFSTAIKTLQGGPLRVGGSYTVGSSKLESIVGAPRKITSSFVVGYNQLKSLEGGPIDVGVNFSCTANQLASLKGAPVRVGNIFECDFNHLKDLQGAPSVVGGSFVCEGNPLESLAGGPGFVGGRYNALAPTLKSLVGLPKEMGDTLLSSGEILLPNRDPLPLLRLFYVKNLKRVTFTVDPARRTTRKDRDDRRSVILAKYLPMGTAGIMPCAAELIKAGYRDYARL